MRSGLFESDSEALRSRIDGLKRAIEDFVGEAKEGRLRRGEDWGICSLVASLARRGDVRLLLGADSSILGRLGVARVGVEGSNGWDEEKKEGC